MECCKRKACHGMLQKKLKNSSSKFSGNDNTGCHLYHPSEGKLNFHTEFERYLLQILKAALFTTSSEKPCRT